MSRANEPVKKPRAIVCPDCGESVLATVPRRDFLKGVGLAAAAAATTSIPVWAVPRAASAAISSSGTAETAVTALYASLSDAQKTAVCFDWDYTDPERGLLRTFVSNNWHITKPTIEGTFFSKNQKMLIHDVFKSLFNPDWYDRLVQQLSDDTGGQPWGAAQNIAIFGKPGDGKFEFVMTGRHMTVRADGNSEAHVALGGPIFHGHAASGFNEKVHHPGNIFWHQALQANQVYQMLDGKQQAQALVPRRPAEASVGFRGADGKFSGIPIQELSSDQKELMQGVLKSLIEPYREQDQKEVMACIERQGGLDKCSLAFFKDGDIGDDGEWDNWRLEGPSLVWYFRGEPHVHIWINVADDASVPLNAKG